MGSGLKCGYCPFSTLVILLFQSPRPLVAGPLPPLPPFWPCFSKHCPHWLLAPFYPLCLYPCLFKRQHSPAPSIGCCPLSIFPPLPLLFQSLVAAPIDWLLPPCRSFHSLPNQRPIAAAPPPPTGGGGPALPAAGGPGAARGRHCVPSGHGAAGAGSRQRHRSSTRSAGSALTGAGSTGGRLRAGTAGQEQPH